MLGEYFDRAMEIATYKRLEDGTYIGEIAVCPGAWATGATLEECQHALRDALEDWVLVALKYGHAMPVIGGVDLNAAGAMSAYVWAIAW